MAHVTFKGTAELLGFSGPFHELSYLATLADAERSFSGGVYTIVSDDVTMIPVEAVLGFLSMGGSVEGYPVFIKLTKAVYDNKVPSGISNRLNDKDVSLRWDEWHDANHNHMQTSDGDYLVPGNSWGEELTGSELLILASKGYTLWTAETVKEDQKKTNQESE